MKSRNTVYACFKDRVNIMPDKLAVFDEERCLSYRQLDMLAGTIAGQFTNNPGFVGVVMDHSVEMIASIFAVLRAGAAYVPVEPDFPVERVRHIMEECDVDFIITHKKYAERLPDFPMLFIERGIEAGKDGSLEKVRGEPESLAYVLYTSGSTGMPKGVAVENRNICHYAKAFCNEFHPSETDIMLQYSVCSFDIFVEEVFPILLSGAALAIPSDVTRNDINVLMKFISDNRITMISGFPYLLLEMNKLEEIPECIRLLISGGDVLRESYVSNLLKHTNVYNTYGPSETTVCASYFRCNGVTPQCDGTFPIGKAVEGTYIVLLDEAMRRVEDGQVGEICILGGGVSRGYVGNVPKENEAFVVWEGERLYRSGDLGVFLPDGNLTFLKRKDTQVMILGKRVESSEVENILCTCNEVEQAVVCPNVDEQGLSYLTAYVVSRNGSFSVSSIKKEMAEFLPSYMIPEYFVLMNGIPLTLNGKIDEKALPVVLKEGVL